MIIGKPFLIRGINVCESLSRHTPRQTDRLLQRLTDWQMNTLIVHPQYGYRRHAEAICSFCQEHQFRLIHYLYTVLAFTPNAPADVFAVNSSGLPHRQRVECETRLCASNAKALHYFREGARRYIDENVQAGDEILLATPDGGLFCQCESCRGLNPTEQWQPFLEICVEEILCSGKPITTHFIAYVGRFRPPKNMDVFEHIDAVMFDTHLRYRWLPLGVGHSMGPIEAMEGQRDPSALHQPINIYLLERLKEWRQVFSGQLYVFENLMIQSCFSLPQPNTAVLLKDLETFRSIGIDGVIYEAFEPGITAFEDQLAILSGAMAGKFPDYKPTRLEILASKSNDSGPVITRTLRYLFEDQSSLTSALQEELKTSEQKELARLITDYLPNPIYSKWREIVCLVIQHQDTLDWIYIAYRAATYLPPEQRPRLLTSEQQRLFATSKPWDFLEEIADPHIFMNRLLLSFPNQIEACS